jgi:hypothetical protein
MPLDPKFMKLLAEKIAEALTDDRIEEVVFRATGYQLYDEYGGPGDPMNRAIYKALDQLTQKGTERWLLTHVLVQAIANDTLSNLIVKVCPESLIPRPTVEAQVQRVIESLKSVKTAALTPDHVDELKDRCATLPAVSQQVATLFAYKSRNECLHALQMQLSKRSTSGAAATPGASLGDLAECRQKMEFALTSARICVEPLGWSPEVVKPENGWIDALQDHATRLQSQLAAPGEAKERLDTALLIFDDVLHLIRQHLVRLNQRIFDTANDLSLTALLAAMPDLIQAEDYFEQFKTAIRELNPTVLARTLVHKFWQDTDKEISLMEDILDTPSAETHRFREHWVTLRRRILWLAALEANAEWAQKVAAEAENIDDQLAAEAADDVIRPTFETLRSFAKYRFFAVDDALKKDCDSLRRINEPLKSMLEEIRNA